MWKKVIGISLVAVIGYFVYEGYRDYYKLGLDTRPEMPDGAFSMTFESGFRAILVDVPNERDVRRYFGIPAKVPFYLEDAWSFCTPSTKEYAASFLAQRGNNPGEVFVAVCRIQVDDDEVVRGFITSVPKL